MAKRTSSPTRILIILLLFVLCISAVGAVWIVGSLPEQAAQQFGVPAPGLSAVQRLNYAARLYWYQNDLLSPVNPDGKQEPFTVDLGEAAGPVAGRLEAAGLIRNAEAFRIYLVYSGLDTTLQAGEYSLSPAMNAVDIANKMQDSTPAQVAFNVLPGWRAEEIAAALPTSGLRISPQEFLRLVNHPDGVDLPNSLKNLQSLEGFLMPGNYKVDRKLSAQQLLLTLTRRFDASVTGDLRQAFKDHHLNLAKAVTLASIVQREAVVVDEEPQIASVFLNRLAANMVLGSDPTVQFALGYNQKQKTWWTNPLSLDDLKVNSPYNTYVQAGLPPGPISNPGMDALRAVAYPAETPYYYFRALCDGTGRHAFAVTLDEHIRNACP
jgi:UPF0755 protein